MELAVLLVPYSRTILVLGCGIMSLAGWWCQFYRYPSFRKWSENEFTRLHAGHTFQISLVVIPGMLLQILGTGLVFISSGALWLKLLHVACVGGSLLPTFLVSGPIHGRLSRGKDDALIEKLIRTNLPRTLVWTLQLILSLA